MMDSPINLKFDSSCQLCELMVSVRASASDCSYVPLR